MGEKVLNNDEMFKREIEFLKESGVPYIIFWTDDTLKPLEQNADKLKQAATNFENYVSNFIKKYL